MIRTQVYITNAEKQKLAALSQELGASQSDLIRQAIDQFISHKMAAGSDRIAALKAAKGLWAERKDLPDFGALRKEFDDRSKK